MGYTLVVKMLDTGRVDRSRRAPEFPASPEVLLGWTERRVLEKLGFRSRVQVSDWALEQGLTAEHPE